MKKLLTILLTLISLSAFSKGWSTAIPDTTYPHFTVFLNMGQSGFYVGTFPPWNNTAAIPTLNSIFSNLKDSLGNITTAGLKILSSGWDYSTNGTNTGSNSGVYPDKVLISAYLADTTVIDTAEFFGLEPNAYYKLIFMSGSNSASTDSTIFTVGAKSAKLLTYHNTSSTASIDSIQADGTGNIQFNFNPDKNTDNAYLNSVLIQPDSAGHTPPTAFAGNDTTLPAGSTSDTLHGSGSSPYGAVTYQWTTTSSATIVSPTSATTAVTGLANGNSYTFVLKVTDIDNSYSTSSTVVTVQNPPIIDTADYKIPVDTNGRFWQGDTIFYQVNDLTSSGIVNILFDQQNLDPLHGVDTPISQIPFTSGFSSKVYYPAQIVVDLGAMYKVDTLSIYDYFGTDTFNVAYGAPENWMGTLKYSESSLSAGWNNKATGGIYTRYLKLFYSNTGNAKVCELILYGHLENDSLTRTNPAAGWKPSPTPLTMGQFIGFNEIEPAQVDSVGSLMRHYEEFNWIDTTSKSLPVDSVKFVFDTFGADTVFNDSTAGMTNYFFPGAPTDSTLITGPYVSNKQYNAAAQQDNGAFDAFTNETALSSVLGLYKPIDTAQTHSYDATNPLNYARVSRMFWNYAAYNGFTKHPADSMQDPYPTASGMSLYKFVEPQNEPNGDWAGADKYFNPQQITAYMSAVYDGDLGAIGSRMGIRNADTNMTVVQPGTAGADTTYDKGIHYFSYYKRSDHSVPFQVVNFHTYPTNGTNGGGTNAHALSPEDYFLDSTQNVIAPFMQFAHLNFPGMPVWCTEWGYDRNRATTLSVPIIQGLDSAQIQAQWIARFWFMLSFSGVQRSTIFQLHNDPLGTMYDSLGTTTFNTTGLVDGHYVGNQFTSLYATSYYAFPAYYFQRTIWKQLYNYRPDSIVEQNGLGDSIYMYRYVNVNSPDSVAYAIWEGTQSNKSTTGFKFHSGSANQPIRIVNLVDKQFLGISSTMNTGTDSTYNLTISETPQLLFTTTSSANSLVPSGTTVAPGTLNFYSVYYLSGKVIIVFKDAATGKLYNMTLKSQ